MASQESPIPTYAHLTRSKAAKLIGDVRKLLAARKSPEEIERALQENYGVDPLVSCPGEAHQNGHQDHCGVCMPHWGYVGPEVTVR